MSTSAVVDEDAPLSRSEFQLPIRRLLTLQKLRKNPCYVFTGHLCSCHVTAWSKNFWFFHPPLEKFENMEMADFLKRNFLLDRWSSFLMFTLL